MQFAVKEKSANGQAALALAAGIIKSLREILGRDETVAIFEEALRVAPDHGNRVDDEAREIIAALLKELVPE